MTSRPQTPTIYEVIRTAHRIASTLLEELADTSEQDVARREQLLAKVEQVLAVHARTEDAVFYDLLMRDPRTRALVEKAQQEHDVVLRLLDDLDRAQAGGAAWDDMMAHLTATVAQHIQEEESELFPAMERLIDDEQARRLANRFEAEQAKVEGEQRAGTGPDVAATVSAPAEHRRSDQSIVEDIRTQLAGHVELDATDIKAGVVDGEVTLSGTVDDRYTKFMVEELVEAIPGVTDVYNLVSVRSDGREVPGSSVSTPSSSRRPSRP